MAKVDLDRVKLVMIKGSNEIVIGVMSNDGSRMLQSKNVTQEFLGACVSRFCGHGEIVSDVNTGERHWITCQGLDEGIITTNNTNLHEKENDDV